jgi:dihydrofolate reductase
MIISLIAALGQNQEIGKNGHIIWKIPEDLNNFKKITMGYPILMGRKTFESFGGKLLPGRTHLVVSSGRQPFESPNLIWCRTPEDAMEQGEGLGVGELFVIGGGEIYKQLIDKAQRFYLSWIEAQDRAADTYFPSLPSQLSPPLVERYYPAQGVYPPWRFEIRERMLSP